MNRRILAFALIAVFAVVLFGGCSETKEETIENTIRDYYSAYNAEAWEGCLGHIDDTNKVGESTIESMLRTTRAAMGEATVSSVTNVSITGSTATADVTTTYASGSRTEQYRLVEKDGSWKISWQ